MASNDVVVSLRARVRDLETKLENVEEDLRDTGQQAERTGEQVESVGRRSSDASQLIFSLGDATQDAQFGLAGVSNNIAFASEQFVDLQQRTGGTRQALQSLATSFLGPAGVVFGIQAALTLLPQLTTLFGDAQEKAEDAADQVDAFASAVSSVVDVTSGQIAENLTLSLEQARDAVGQTENRIRAIKELIEAVPEEGILSVRQFEQLSPLAQQIARDLVQQNDVLSLTQGLVEDELNLEKGILQTLQEQTSELEKQVRAARRLQDLGARPEGEVSISGVDASAIDAANVLGGAGTDGIGRVSADALRGVNNLNAQYRRLQQQIRAANIRQSILFRSLRRSATIVSGQFGALIADIVTFDESIQSVGDAFRRLADIAQQAIQQIIQSLIQATVRAALFRAISGLFGSPASLLFPSGGASGTIVPTSGPGLAGAASAGAVELQPSLRTDAESVRIDLLQNNTRLTGR
jgi:chromosome segregation ATPase